MSYFEAIRNRISVREFTTDIIRTAYDNDRAYLNQFDQRVLLIWFVFFNIVPWLFYDTTPLLIILCFVSALAVQSKVSKYLLVLLFFGVVSNISSYAVLVALLSGDNLLGVTQAQVDAVGALVPFVLKLTTVSILNLTMFSSMSPEDLSKGLSGLGVPRQGTFVISYGVRMMPVLVEEYHSIVNSFRMRSAIPRKLGPLKWRYYWHLLKLMVKAFYPLVFDTAKRSRITVEALETKGFSESLRSRSSKQLRHSDLMIQMKDVGLLVSSALGVILLIIWT